MVKTKKKKRSKKKEKDLDDENLGIISSMSPETVRGILGVFIFVVAIILTLSALGLAGILGKHIYDGIYYIVGIGYWLLPIMLVGWTWFLFSKASAQNKLQTIRATGAVFFFLSSLGIISVTASKNTAGLLGALIAKPLVSYLDTIATLVVLAGILIISLLLLFDGELWVLIAKKTISLFSGKNKNTTDDTDDDNSLKQPENTETKTEFATENTKEADTNNKKSGDEEFADYDIDVDMEKINSAEKTKGPKQKKKRRDSFQLPSKYNQPPLSILEGDRGQTKAGDTKVRSNVIRKTLQHFKIPVEMDEVTVGPSVTRYALKPAAGVRLSKILALQSNLELALAASPIRIEAPIPGKSLVGIEVPNSSKSLVGLNSLISSPEFSEETIPLFVALGKDITGSLHYANIGKMPHLLVAGTTGSGKSVMIHSLVTSLLYRNGPERVKFIMVDPKRVELTLYNGIPHLLTPVITDAKKCILSLKWAAKEMERRYDILQEHKVQDIAGYHNEVVAPSHKKIEKAKEKGKDINDIETPEPMPHIVIIIDELSDIMSSYPKELEAAIVRLAQMSRAVGIHLILSTQRPSAQVITGLIKANIPTRIALKVSSLLESRIILDQPGAEKLLGAGDMLYLSGDMAKPRRIQSPFLTTPEVKKIVSYIIKNNEMELDEAIDFTNNDGNGASAGISFDKLEQDDDLDTIYDEVREFVINEKKASTSLIQRRFRVGYGRAARIMDQLEQRGVISASDGTNKPRRILDGALFENNTNDKGTKTTDEEYVSDSDEAYE